MPLTDGLNEIVSSRVKNNWNREADFISLSNTFSNQNQSIELDSSQFLGDVYFYDTIQHKFYKKCTIQPKTSISSPVTGTVWFISSPHDPYFLVHEGESLDFFKEQYITYSGQNCTSQKDKNNVFYVSCKEKKITKRIPIGNHICNSSLFGEDVGDSAKCTVGFENAEIWKMDLLSDFLSITYSDEIQL